jgi:hypothetical protein
MAGKKFFSHLARACLAGFLFVAGFMAVPRLVAQTAGGGSSVEPDVLIFTDGEKLIGHLVRSTGEKLTFKSDMTGEITVEWAKVKELRSSQRFAVVPKNVKLHHVEDAGTIPQGTIAVTDQKIAVSPGAGHAAQTMPVADAAYVVDEVAFRKALHNPGIWEGWKGGMTAGISLVEATQNSRTFTGSVGLIRAIPSEEWLEPRNRTLVDFSAAYGKLTQPNTPTVKTSIYHADGERDQYFSPRFYGFGQLSYDHNFSQGLDLQQAYGGGIGWTILKSAKQTLDLKGGMTYVNQKFQAPAESQNLIGSTIGERYTRILIHGLLFDEQLSVTPAWNNTKAYSAVGSAGLTLPVYKRLSVALSSIDTFLNDPPPGFKKNSFQFTTGIAYTLR